MSFDITSLGEVLIDFTQIPADTAGASPVFEANPGGGPANVVATAGKLGAKVAIIGKTGEDRFGRMIAERLAGCNVYTGGLRVSQEQHTTLAFVSLSPSGEREFSFCRNPGADTQLSLEDLDLAILDNTTFLHVSSLSLCMEPAYSTTFAAIRRVKAKGGLISYDPNWRKSLWPDEQIGLEAVKSLIPFANVLKVSDEELYFLHQKEFVPYREGQGEEVYRELSDPCLDSGVFLVLVTLGPGAVYYRSNSFDGIVGCPRVKTTGAGHSFTGALLFGLSRNTEPLGFSEAELRDHLTFANELAISNEQ
jgi:fructokinase